MSFFLYLSRLLCVRSFKLLIHFFLFFFCLFQLLISILFVMWITFAYSSHHTSHALNESQNALYIGHNKQQIYQKRRIGGEFINVAIKIIIIIINCLNDIQFSLSFISLQIILILNSSVSILNSSVFCVSMDGIADKFHRTFYSRSCSQEPTPKYLIFKLSKINWNQDISYGFDVLFFWEWLNCSSILRFCTFFSL